MRSSWITHPLGSYEAVVQHAAIQPFRGRWERETGGTDSDLRVRWKQDGFHRWRSRTAS